MIDRKFNVFKNLDRIAWKATIWINLLRATCAIPIWILLGALSNNHMPIGFYVFYPFFYLAIWGPFLCLLKAIIGAFSEPMGGIVILLFVAISISGGDPFVFLIHKLKPEIVPIEKYPFISFVIFSFVLKDN